MCSAIAHTQRNIYQKSLHEREPRTATGTLLSTVEARAALPLGRSRSRPAWLPAALAAVEEELVSPRALSVLVDALADGPVALADVFLVRVRVRARARVGLG